MTRKTRQEFKRGQVVMLHDYHSTWHQAVVVDPDIEERERRWSTGNYATVHGVRLWEQRSQWWSKQGKGDLVPPFYCNTYRNSRKTVLGLEEYEATVGIEIKARVAAIKAAVEQTAIDRRLGVDIICREIREAMGVGAEHETEELRTLVEIYVADYTLTSTGRGRDA